MQTWRHYISHGVPPHGLRFEWNQRPKTLPVDARYQQQAVLSALPSPYKHVSKFGDHFSLRIATADYNIWTWWQDFTTRYVIGKYCQSPMSRLKPHRTFWSSGDMFGWSNAEEFHYKPHRRCLLFSSPACKLQRSAVSLLSLTLLALPIWEYEW